MDASIGESSIPSGRYKLTPVHTSDLAKMDAWMVNISVVSTGCSCPLKRPDLAKRGLHRQ
jgi:hypothetical protein